MKNDMKQFLTLIVSIFVMVVLAAEVSSAQSIKVLKTRGQMFITSASFFQSLTRRPYNVLPGTENAIYNGKKANFSDVAISQFLGFQFNPYLALGAGISFEYWTNKSGFVPLYVDFRVNITEGKIAPHCYLNAGYAPRWSVDNHPYNISTGTGKMYAIHGYTSGWIGEIGIGIKASVSRASAVLITVSGKVQESSLRYHPLPEPTQGIKPLLVNTDSHSLYFFVGVKAGFVF
jgi:hypothetical protein